ncbi:MAG TPA: thioredoxin-like domain-containing protein [Ferruginibacter sp.]|nr:thioredoxin-like domain-containing protein [Ferruginibacter sp.]HRO06924.1 thioredoxin-like domain-containing protein [Ferruginibacter sp.]HRO96913.1 thioredoxin-like domain-containing protein [Ferruginibacter sp.]HRP50011.1 thioredoxin-like domain-containing protein [Ferruginibacter sp.]
MRNCFTLLLLIGSLTATAQFKVTLTAPQYASGTAYLTYHWGKSLNIADSAEVNANGVAVFEGEKSLPGGIYSVVFPGKRLTADFFIDQEQTISITANDTLKLMDMVVTGSPENDLFKKYQQYTAEKGGQLQRARNSYNASKTKEDSLKHEATFSQLNKELADYRNSIATEHPESMLASMLNAMKEPTIPIRQPLTREDSIANYNYYKEHYWDGITFMDDRVVRTPFFIPKFERYYREVMHQAPDSIIQDVDYKLLLARSAPELYKFMLNWLTDEYINPKYMGQDAIFVHLFNKYHSKGLTPWLNEKQMETITRRAYMQMSNLVGEKAANLNLVDSTGKLKPLYDVKGDYTIVIFWDPNCGHCKQEVPRIDSIYKASWKQKNVKLYAVLSDDHKKEWVNFIKKHELNEWTHVYQTKEMEEKEKAQKVAGFRQLYDVIQTPTIYLLDKEKRIVGKKLTLEQINDLLEVKWKNDNK